MIGFRRIPKASAEDTWQYQVMPTAGYAHTPVITRYAGAPAAVWDWGDGSAPETGDTMSHTYASAGTCTVTVRLPNVAWWLKTVDVNTDKVNGDFLLTLLSMTRLTQIKAYNTIRITSNCGLFNIGTWAFLENLQLQGSGITGNISGWVLPGSLTQLHIASTALSGDISGWALPTSLQYLYVFGTGVSGDIGGWTLPASLIDCRMNSTSLSGSPVFTSAVALGEFDYQDCALPQATVDLILSRMYARRASFTAASPTANLGGSNADPSGTYQAMVPPTTGNEAKYELVNDSASEGFKKWAITT